MKKVKKLLVILTMLTAVFSLSYSSVYAGELRKGTCRVVLFDEEILTNANELVYNGHRYLSGDLYALIFSIAMQYSDLDCDYSYSETNPYSGYATYYFTPSGYMTLQAGSVNGRIGYYYDADDFTLIYPAAMYDTQMYVSMEDIAKLIGCNYGFDAYKNTMYFY